MDPIAAFQQWADAHPTIVTLVVVPLAGALFNLLFKPKTPEQYARWASFSPRLAAFLILMGTFFPDPDKARKIVLGKLLPGTQNPPRGPNILPLIALVAIGLGASACSPKAWAVADLLARKIQCSVANQNLPNERIIQECVLEPGDVERVLAIVGTSRVLAADEALGAANRQAEQEQRTGACK